MTVPGQSTAAALFRGLRLASSRPMFLSTSLIQRLPLASTVASQGSGVRTYVSPPSHPIPRPPAGVFPHREPPALLKLLQGDLKSAMQAKDTNHLSAIRGVLTEVANRDKMTRPVTRDEQVVGLMRRQIIAMQQAAAEFMGESRDDLVDKEEATIAHLERYIASSGVEEVTGEALVALVRPVAAEAHKKGEGKSQVMKALLHGAEGKLGGKTVEKGELSRIVGSVLGELNGEEPTYTVLPPDKTKPEPTN